MKRLESHCLDCGSAAVASVVDEMKPVFKMKIVTFACGATMTTSHSANGNIGKVIHSGCNADQEV